MEKSVWQCSRLAAGGAVTLGSRRVGGPPVGILNRDGGALFKDSQRLISPKSALNNQSSTLAMS